MQPLKENFLLQKVNSFIVSSMIKLVTQLSKWTAEAATEHKQELSSLNENMSLKA